VPDITEANNEEDVRRCWPAFQALRPHLTGDEFIRRWKAQSEEGYRIVCIESGDTVVAAAGFRIMNTMAWGKCGFRRKPGHCIATPCISTRATTGTPRTRRICEMASN